MSRVPWRSSAYRLLNKEGEPDLSISLWGFWQNNKISLSALLIMVCWTNQQTALYKLAPKPGHSVTSGCEQYQVLEQFFFPKDYQGSENWSQSKQQFRALQIGRLKSCSINTAQTVLTAWLWTNDCPTHYPYDLPICSTPLPPSIVIQCDDHFE